MSRALVLGLAAIGFAAVLPAAAAPASSPPSSSQVIAAPVQPVAARSEAYYYAPPPPPPAPRGSARGGGFIEMLFDGRPAPRYAPPGAMPEPAGRSTVIVPSTAAPYDEYYVPPVAPAEPPRSRYYPSTEYPSATARGPAPEFRRTVVPWDGPQKPGSIVIDTATRHLYLVQEGGKALRYGVGVGRPGFEWKGTKTITAKREWPDWRPPAEMLQRQPHLPRHMPGGPNNPLGARAMYLGSTLYRIHGSNEPHTIGHAVSSGCFRMTNEDVMDLYSRVKVGTQVTVL